MTGCFIDSGLDHGIFLNSDISQGSVVTQLRCGGIINEDLVANLLVNLSVKEFWKSVNVWRSYEQYYSGLFFIDSHSILVGIFWFHFTLFRPFCNWQLSLKVTACSVQNVYWPAFCHALINEYWLIDWLSNINCSVSTAFVHVNTNSFNICRNASVT